MESYLAKHRSLLQGGEALKLLNQLAPLAPTTAADTVALATIGAALSAYALRGYVWDRPDPYQHLWFERPQAADGSGGAGKSATRNIAERAEELGKNVIIFWGSQSGTAEGFANRLAQELPRRFPNLEAMAADLSDYDPDTIALLPQTRLALFVLATYGEGDPSDNASAFCDWLSRGCATISTKDNNNKSTPPLASLRYAAFGLGNSDYQHYNRVVDRVAAALDSAGAEALLPVGRADARRGTTEEDFLAWKDQLCAEVLEARLGFAAAADGGLEAAQQDLALNVVEDPSLDLADLHTGHPVHPPDGGKSGATSSPIRALRISQSRELFTGSGSSSDRHCLHLELDLSSTPELTYKTGDHLAVWPINPDQEVDRLLGALGLNSAEKRATPVLINARDPAVKVKIPSPTSIDALLRYYLEVSAPVSRATARALASFAPSPAAKEFLLRVSRDRDAFADLLARTHVTLGRLLEMASDASGGERATWDGLSLSYLVEILPRTQPRYYSISSSSITSPRAPAITVLVANTELAGSSDGTTTQAASIPGLATNYLLSLSNSLNQPTLAAEQQGTLTYALSGPSSSLEGGLVHAHIRRSKFKLPALSSCPLVMVAAGTGLAPFRAFITERARLRAIGKPVGRMLLVFGCRRPDEDYIYRDELELAERALEGSLRIVTAFSRAEGAPKAYVQDRVRELGTEVSELVGDDASIYICGRASMAREVGKSIGGVIAAEKGWGEGEVAEWSARMKRGRKWQEDVWG